MIENPPSTGIAVPVTKSEAALETELSRRRLQVRRIDAELAGVPMKRESTDPAEIYVQAAAQHQDRRQGQSDEVA